MAKGLKRLVLVSAVAAVVYAAVPSAAGAATTVGEVQPAAVACVITASVAQTGTAGGNLYRVPQDGVLTSWSSPGNAGASGMVKLKVWRTTSTANVFLVVGESNTVAQSNGAPSGLPVRVPVQAGDLLGLTSDAAGACANVTTGSTADMVQYCSPACDPPPGSTAPLPTNQTNIRMNVAARLEADADKDNFGDETQDQCFTDPSTQGPCPAPTLSGNAVNGQTLTATKGGNPNNLSFQWLRCDASGNGCTPIPGANGASYKLTFADIGHAIRVRQSQSNSSGTQTIDSTATNAVAPASGRCANALNGTAGNDTLLGSTGGDRIHGLAGRDNVNGANGADCLYGDAGNDRVTGAAGGDRVFGASGRDRLSGGSGNDRLFGGAGNDRISAGAGKNRVSGGSGNDVINTANGQRDTVNCGTGRRDRIRADTIDRLRGCEIRRLV